MTDFLSRLTSADPPVAKKITIGKETGTVHFRRITAGERRQLLEGQKIQHNPGSSATVEIDLGLNEKEKHLLVMFSVCTEEGTRVFGDTDQVANMPNHKFKKLLKCAEEVNRGLDDEELGKD